MNLLTGEKLFGKVTNKNVVGCLVRLAACGLTFLAHRVNSVVNGYDVSGCILRVYRW